MGNRRKKRYEKILGTIKHNSGGDMAPVAKISSVKQTCCAHGDMEPREFRNTLKAACGNGDAIRGETYVCVPNSDQWVREAIQYVVENTDNPKQFVANANGWLAQ